MLVDGYRPALDGVRAFAVMAVIAYHLGVPVFGGYLGVDVFFVLSGYLITRLLLEEHRRAGRVDLVQFWTRRARRLLPALVPVALLCAVMASRGPLLDMEARRADILSTLAYYANWHFIQTDQSYFASYNGASPLRHMWSLAIEEQFYLAWPLVLAGLAWALRRRQPWLIVPVVVAVAVSAWRMVDVYDDTNPSRAYFGTDARAFQLLVGAALAAGVLHARSFFTSGAVLRVIRTSVPVLLFVLVVMVALLPEASPHYFRGASLAFALSVGGLLLAIELGQAPRLTRKLSLRPLVLTGRVSYGLYLWHWPLLVFSQGSQLLADRPAWLRGVVVLGLTAATAAASYVLVEQPVRSGRTPWVRSSPRRLAAVAPAVLLVTAAFTVVVTTDDTTVLARQVSDTSVTACPPASVDGWCLRASPDVGEPTIAVVGDSTALALDPGMTDLAARRGWGYVQGGRNGCSVAPVPVQAPDPSAAPIADACVAGAVALLESIQAGAAPDLWVISDRLLLSSLHGAGDIWPLGTAQHSRAVVDGLRQTLDRLSSWGTVALLETPPRGEPLDCALDDRTAACDGAEFSTEDSDTGMLAALYRSAVEQAARPVHLVSVTDLLCGGREGRCPANDDDVLIRYDSVHYTARFSRLLAPLLVTRLEQSGALPA